MKINDLFKKINSYEKKLYKPLIIAEIGVNHEGDMEMAKNMIKDAKKSGADVVKFQTYKADTLASKNSPAYWDTKKETTKSQHELFKKHEGFWIDEMKELKIYCDSLDIEFLSTPFDFESARFLNDMMNAFKISSSDITNKPFIEFICNFGKPIILSTGASSLSEITEAVSWIEEKGNDLALLHCVLNYPTLEENANLGMILDLKQRFPDKLIGYSDHTLPKDMKICEIACLLGAVIIEKHFTHDKTLPGNDHYHAMDKNDLKLFVSNVEKTFDILGNFKVCSLENQSISRINARRSIVASKNMKKGHIVSAGDLTFKRPATGISPKFVDKLIGKVILEDIQNDDILKWNMFSWE